MLGVAVLLFFQQVFTKGAIPFPGDLLVGSYAPYNSYSNNGYAPGGVPHKAQGIDVIRQLYPWKYLAVEDFKSGLVPLWNPYNFSGTPLLANYQTGAFYPFNILFILPFNFAWTLFIMLQPVLGFIFMYLYLRQLKLSKTACSFGAVSFAFSLYMTVWLQWGNIGHTIIWLPLLLFIIEKLKQAFNIKWLVVTSLVYAFAVLAGYAQQVIYISAVVISYFIFQTYGDKFFIRKFTFFLLAISLAFLISAVQLLPTFELFGESARGVYGKEVLSSILAPWYYLVVLIVPDFFGNPAYRNYFITGTYIERVMYPGLLALISALFISIKDKTAVYFLILLVISLLFGVDNPISQTVYGLRIPIIATTIPTRIFSLSVFALSVLGAIGLSQFIDAKNEKTYKRLLVLPLLLAGIWLLALLISKYKLAGTDFNIVKKGLFMSSAWTLLITGLLFIAGRLKRYKNKIAVLLILLTAVDLYIYFSRITPFVPANFIYPKTAILEKLKAINSGYFRFWGYGTGYIDSNLASFEKIYSSDGYDPLFIRRYGEFMGASKNGKLSVNIPRSDVVLHPGYGTEDLKNNRYRKRAMDLLSIKYVLYKNESGNSNRDSTFSEDEYNLLDQVGVWQIYENRNAVARMMATDDYLVENNSQLLISKLFDSKFNPNSTIILESDPGININIKTGTSGAQLKFDSYGSNRVAIEADLASPKLILLTDNYYPGWNAYVDGKKSAVYRANYTFRAVAVGAGKHTVEFIYEPLSYKYGKTISIVAVIFIALISGCLIIYKKYEQKAAV